jgi:hypothetical protein
LLTEANAGWTSAHKLSGVAYLAIKLKWDADVFQGIPDITALVSGRKVYDPREDSTSSGYVTGGVSTQRFSNPSTWTFSTNPSLCLRDYITNARFGKGLPASAIDDVAFSAAATDCDETVTFYGGGATGRIFDINAVLQTDETLFSNIEKMLMGCRGFLPYTQGKYGLLIDKSRSVSYAFDTDTIVGGISIQGESKEDKFNRVIVKFANPAVDYQPDQAVWPEAGSTEETAFLSEDNGTLLVTDLDMPTVTNYYAARDLARVILNRSRSSLRCSFKATSEALQLSVGDVVTLTHPTPAWVAKPFQIEEITLNYDGTCSVSLLQYDSTIYTYDLAAQEITYPQSELPDPFQVTPPTSFQSTSGTYIDSDGTVFPTIQLSWVAALDSFVSSYIVEWKKVSEAASAYQAASVSGLKFDVTGIQSGVSYNINIYSVNSLGVKSSAVSLTSSSVGDTTAPALPTSLSATAGYKSISLSLTNPSDKDFSNIEVYRATSSGGTFSLVASIGGGWGAATEFLNGGLADATAFFYKFKSVDYSGNKSAFTAEVTATTNAAAINGSDGTSTFTAPIFRRSATALSAPTGGTFNFGTNTLTAPTDWYTAVPSGTDPIYQATFQFSVSGDTGTVTAGTWSTPVIIAENGVNGDPGDDGLSTFVFPVYKRSDTEPDDPTGGSYNFSTNTITPPTGWSASVPSGTDPIYISSTQAQISGPTGTDSTLSWTAAILFVENGSNGVAGKSTFTAPIFKRASSAPSAPTGGTFNFGTNTLTPPTSWSITIPSGTDPIYQANFQFSVSGDTGTVTAGTWSAPVIIAENGTDGDPGGDGLSTFVFPVYKRASSVPTSPSGGSYNFSTNAITAPTGWSSSIPSGTDPIYASTTQAQITGPTGTDSSLTWTTPIIFVQNGTDGDPGGDGQSTFTAPIFRRASTAPSAPTGGTFNFGTNTLTPPTDWSITVPTGTDPIYQANFQFSITGDTGTVTAGTWSAPVVIAANGTDGDPGANGLSTFTLSVHKRASSAPLTPTGGSYNFTSNTVTAPTDWFEEVPSGTDPIYVSTTKAQISGATGTDSSLTWSTPVILAQNGIDGNPGSPGDPGAAGPRNADGYLYYSVSQASAPASPSASSYNFVTGSFAGLTANWSTTPPTNTVDGNGDAKYWATYWHVTEATFGGTQTLTFNTPFNSVQFDGLVTFTNLNSELANASSTEITTINGGLLKTGTIDVAQVNIAGTAGASGLNIKSATSGERMEITSSVLKVYDSSDVLRVKLGNLA